MSGGSRHSGPRRDCADPAQSTNGLDVKEIVNLWAGGFAAVKSMPGATGMNARELGIICVLLAAVPNLAGCESSLSQDYQFEKQVERAQECRHLQDKLVGDQPLTHERSEEIANTMKGFGCTARLP
jgi:hypothetical protein